MTFEQVLDQAIALLQRRGRVTYRTLKRQFQLDDAALEDLTVELIKGQRLAVDEDGEVLVWTGAAAPPPGPSSPPAPAVAGAPLTYTPPYLVEKILTLAPPAASVLQNVSLCGVLHALKKGRLAYEIWSVLPTALRTRAACGDALPRNY